jgi:hypothetical protein
VLINWRSNALNCCCLEIYQQLQIVTDFVTYVINSVLTQQLMLLTVSFDLYPRKLAFSTIIKPINKPNGVSSAQTRYNVLNECLTHQFLSYNLSNKFYVVVLSHRPPLWSSCQSSWLQIQRSGFDSRRYQIFSEK